MTGPVLVSPAGEVRRVRAELAELRGLLAAYLAADPGPVVPLGLARQWAAEAYDRGHADGIEAGRLAVVAELKAAQHELHDVVKDSVPVWAMHAAALRRSA